MFLLLCLSSINISIFIRSQNTSVLQDGKFSILRSESFTELLVITSKGKVSWNINSSLIKFLITIITLVLHCDVKSRDIGMYKVLFQPKESLASKKDVWVEFFFFFFFLN